MSPTANEYQALKTRVDYLYRVVRAYRKLNRALFVEATESLRPHFVAKQAQWQAIGQKVDEQSEKLKQFEHEKLDKQPSFEECVAHDWAEKHEKVLLAKCRHYMQETLKMCGKVDAQAEERARKEDAVAFWLHGSWDQVKQIAEQLIEKSKKELIGQSD
ncbi:hypothetical protein HBH56_115780 [Parastagonospora nodorum]|uniref:Uncharacterized protein n=1 Tax=Phaeosphaeria nodorum (strain SN15 / ATCC MYA-4574 / FGSC 10173) TaxID=321614 RepID=A0A7U2FGX1_PHANO|nr:hypothetical protein HBH56_115780 [Parastagonospora nodorum]QRD05063.1 hypothetical protein JI435_109870 [Parastagonospora nodorum SN15]KAH3928773.1 hypothetical protein HBH54_133370 [Parastagonospora nodorum]KAH4136833.1 hypothetical protein HBH45_131540 [Parastagonospora nodorum]KAH4160766.1 hypothetical protein HBH44_100720 [Parastagonospora nodorum]